MKKLNVIVVALIGASTLWITGCNKKDAQNQAANVKFKITDAPAEFDALNIDVQGIQAHTEAQGWVDVSSSLGTINILSYVNGNTALIADAQLPAGDVDQIRLVLGTNNSIVVNGSTTAISMPSSLQAGLVVNVNTELQAGGSYEWTIDFDAAQSVMAGAAGGFELRPVLRLIVDEQTSLTLNGGGTVNTGGSGTAGGSVAVNGNLMGNVSGSIGTASGLAIVTAVSADGQTSVSTITSITGNFTLQALAAGSYTISIDPMLPLLSTHTMQNVSVTAGSTTNLGLVAL